MFAVLAFSLVLTGTAMAQTATLSGVVYGGSSPLVNATVEALTNGTTTAVATSVTNSSGQYSLDVSPATYDLRVTPPAGSGFGQEIVQDVEVTANRSFDIILLSSGGPATVTISGTVRGLGGQGIPASLTMYASDTWEWLGNTSTGADGVYSMTVRASGVHVYMNGSASAASPDSWYYRRYNMPLSGPTQLDINLPVASISGTVFDSSGNAVADASISASGNYWDSSTQSEYGSSFSTASSASGAYATRLLHGYATFNVRPPSGTTIPPISEGVQVTGDLVKDFTFAPPLPVITVNGSIRTAGGTPVSGAGVTLYSATTWEWLGSRTSDADGKFSLDITASSIHIYMNGGGNTGTPSSWYWRKYNHAVPPEGQLEITLPVITVSGTVFASSGSPMADASLSANSSFWDGTSQSEFGSSYSTTTGSSGAYSALLFAGNVNFQLRAPTGNTSPQLNESMTATADLVRDFTFAPPLPELAVSGTIRGVGGQPVSSASVTLYNGNTWEWLGNRSTDENGAFSFSVTATSVHLYVNGWGSSVAPSSWYYRRYNVPVADGSTLDINLNVIRLNGTAADSNGSPVPDVSVSANTNSWDGQTESGSSGSMASDATGAYAMLLLSGSGSVSIRPTASSGFSNVNLNGVNLASNLTQRIVLQLPDAAPPVIVTRPVVVHLSDTSVSVGWTTNEPATSRVEFGLGSLTTTLGSNTLSTSHSITLTDLSATAIYTYRVSSSDRAGNGPTYSDTGYFTTQAPPGDITAPVITAGPVVAAVADTSAIIQWSTDEPASSRVEYGSSTSFTNNESSEAGVFVKNHSIRLSALAPATTYYARVHSIDPDGNATVSSTFSFTTAAAPDTQAPVIDNVSIVSVTDSSITVAWVTNEAATSGVSFNDGSAYSVVNDPALVTDHEVTLAGLAAQRTYSITVSSRDAAGNGPTIASTIQATTLAVADTTPPAISDIVVDPAKTAASITWTTNEAASSEVRFGSTSGNLDGSVADLGLASSHSAELTGLFAGTTYYVVIRVTDASGNATATSEIAFTTLAASVNLPPTPPGPFTVSSNPNRTGAFTLTWGASSDDSGAVSSYEVFRNGQSVALLVGHEVTSHSESGLGEGEYRYRVRAMDIAGLTSDSDEFVVIVDQTAPVLSLPAEVTTPATTATDAIVTYSVSATDNRDSNPVVVCRPSSGSVFTIGDTTVNCTASDSAGNVRSESFVVTVTDPFPPVLTIPADMNLDAPNHDGLVVTFTATAVDNVDVDPTVTCSPASGSLFATGETTVSCTATDDSSNSVTRSFKVTITAPPTVPSTTTLTFVPGSPAYGDVVVLTATITTSGTPTGNVEFLDGATVLGTVPLNGASAALSLSSLSVGTHTLSARYDGDDGHTGSTSQGVDLTIGKATPMLAIQDASYVYDGTTKSATGTATGVNGEDLGALTFTYNGSTSAPSNVGHYAVVGAFLGNGNYSAASADGVLSITIASSSMSLLVAPMEAVSGQALRLEATVSATDVAGFPDGLVEFLDGSTSLGTADVVNGQASITVTGVLGAHSYSARYSGSNNFTPATSTAVALSVSPAATTTVLVSAPNPSSFGQPVTLKAGVYVTSPGTGSPTGTVQFFEGAALLGSAPVTSSGTTVSASIVLTGLTAGSHTLTAVFSGDPAYTGSTSAGTSHVVQSTKGSTVTTVSASETSVPVGQSVTLVAVVDPLQGSARPSGQVQFYDGEAAVGDPVLLFDRGSMRAELVTTLATGIHSITAKYAGDATFGGSTSTPLALTVYEGAAPTPTTTTVKAPNKSKFGDPVTFMASVKNPGNEAAPGSVQFFIDGTAEGAPLPVPSSGEVFLTRSGLSTGDHTISAQFTPADSTYAASSGQTTHTVQ